MTRQYLTFTLDNTIYAAEISLVQEVLDYKKPQSLPCPDPVIAGIIQSRGKSISVVNLRRKFGLVDTEPTKETRIIVFELPGTGLQESGYIGTIADSVLEVLEIKETCCEPPPQTGNSIAARFINGICRKDEKFIIMLDISKIFSSRELTTIIHTADTSADTLADKQES